MSDRLNDVIEKFSMADDEMRLELLLDFSKKLPPLPDRFKEQRDAGLNRVPECMSPVFLWVERDNRAVRLYVDVAEEAPTVKGFLSILVSAYDGAAPEDILSMPPNLLNDLHLSNQIRMNRAVGLNAIMGRIKRQVAELQATSSN